MNSKSRLIIIPLLALLISGCTVKPARKKERTSSEGQDSQDVGTSQNPASSESEASSQIPVISSETPVVSSQTPAPSSQAPAASSSIPAASSTPSTSVTPGGDVPKTKLNYTYDDYQKNNVYGLDNCPLSGSPKLLIIPVWFSDSSYFISASKKESVRSDIEKAYVGSNSETGWRSVKTFYQEESLNKLNIQATVTDWYSVSNNSTYYGEDDDYSKTPSLVDSAVTWYFQNNSSDNRRNYDSNSDGFMDGVMLIYAAADGRSNPSAGDNLWAYCYWTDNTANTYNPTAKTFFWASYDFMYDSSNAYDRTGSTDYGGGDCSHCTIDAHTFIHEMGHVLGLEDYYDNNTTELCPAGAFSMQDWNMGGHDPYSVMAYGWAEPYIPTQTATITINDFQSSHDLILLANHSVDSPFDEYVLIELYTPTGLNKFDSDYAYGSYQKGPTQTGIRVWHIDGRLTYPTSVIGQKINWSSSFLTNPNYSKATYGVYHAMANAYGGGYGSVLGSQYYNFNLLQFIRNDTGVNYRPSEQMNNGDLFGAGETFTMSKFQNQFYKTGKMNDNNNLGWSFTVNNISGSQASITVTKQ